MDFVKEDTVLGTKKVVIGDKFHDLVLENLGKIYIRYGNSYKEFNALMLALSKGVTSGGSKVIIEEGGISEDLSTYPNGSLVYDARSGILYLIFNGEAFILAEHVNTNSNRYVLKTGDIMTGPLTINTREAPLRVKSTELVKNLNANYLQGYDAAAFARRNHDETINGNWTFTGQNTFTNKNTFEDTAIFTAKDSKAAIRIGVGDIITDGGLGSSLFVSGMNGSGWRLDSETNTLEIDNLIVRGILNVYELVVNKVSATNGALWITDSFKVKTVHNLEIIECTAGMTINSINFSTEKYYIIYLNVTQSTTYASFEEANDWLNTYNHAKITVSGESLSTRLNRGLQKEMDVYKMCFLVINMERFKNNATSPQFLCSSENLLSLLKLGAIDAVCIYQYNTEDIPDKISSYDDVFNKKFDTYKFRIVTNPDLNEQNGRYYFYNELDDIASVNLYYKYFGGGQLYILESENDEYPVFRPGDILRCLKFNGKSVKQYHSIVCGTLGEYGFIMQIQNHSILNRKMEIAYDEQGNLRLFDVSMDDALYSRSDALVKQTLNAADETSPVHGDGEVKNLSSKKSVEKQLELIEETVESDDFNKLCTPQEGDGLVRIGSIVFGIRRNSMYLTSSENYSPFEDIMVDVNRPDYGVNYFTPKIRKATVQIMIDEDRKIYKEQEVYLQNATFSEAMDKGRSFDPDAEDFDEDAYNAFLLTDLGRIYLKYKDVANFIEVPLSQSDEGDQDFYGLTNVKDVYLTYAENEVEPRYVKKDGERLRVSKKVNNSMVNFYTAPKDEDGDIIKVIEPKINVPQIRNEVTYLSSGTYLKKIAIGWRV